ncbi:MAG: flavodoxin [Elusimicrobiales bacterium]
MPDKEILVVYYSRTGYTKKVAQDLSQRLGADTEEIRDLSDRSGFIGYLKAVRAAMKEIPAENAPASAKPGNYKLLVIGTPVWAWNMTPAVRAYLEMNTGKLPKVAFFTTFGGSGHEKTVRLMEGLSGKKAEASAGFRQRQIGKSPAYEAQLDTFVKTLIGTTAAN